MTIADPVYQAEAERFGLDPNHAVERFGELAIDVLNARRFFAIAADEPIELAVVPPKGAPWVCYPTSCEEHMALAKRGQSLLANGTGVYMVPNQIRPDIVARYPANKWCRSDNGRAADGEIARRRALYVDVDFERPRFTSSTDEEKRATFDVAEQVWKFLRSVLGDDDALGRGDSGNGVGLFVALEPRAVTKADTEAIATFLAALDARFGVPGKVKIDRSVCNPARLVPAFGTRKTKGADTPERPHRRTYLCCRPVVRRVPLEVLCG